MTKIARDSNAGNLKARVVVADSSRIHTNLLAGSLEVRLRVRSNSF